MTRVLLALCLLGALSPPALAETEAIFTLAIGYPHAPDKASLRYPAWDAARLVETLTGIHDPQGRWTQRAVLLADFRSAADRDIFGHLTLRPPTRAALIRAVEDLNRGMDTARALGQRATLYVYYAGHGDVGLGNMGRVYLRPKGREPGRGVAEAFTANDLRRLVLEVARADQIHLMVDACNSYFLLKSRGDEPSSRRSRRRTRLGRRFAARTPNVGVTLSTSGVANVYESRALQGGLFSHVLRSALMGAADLDGDGAVSYGEVGVFFDDAFRGVPNPDRYSPQVYVQAPTTDPVAASDWTRVAMVHLPAQPAQGLVLPAGAARHVLVDDARGLRVAEAHFDGARAFRLWLPGGPDPSRAAAYTVREKTAAGEVTLGVVASTASVWSGPVEAPGAGLSPRGIADRVVERLFRYPLGPDRLGPGLADRATRWGEEAEHARDHFSGLRLTSGVAQALSGPLSEGPLAAVLEASGRTERVGTALGLAAQLTLPTPMDTEGRLGGGDFSRWGASLEGSVGQVLSRGQWLIEPHLRAGPGFIRQTAGGTAWTARAAAGVTVTLMLPYDTPFALVAGIRAGPELLGNLADDDQVDLAWGWTLDVGLDWERPW